MKRSKFVALLLLAYSGLGQAYLPDTHERISREAFSKSVLAVDPMVTQDIGIARGTQLPSTGGASLDIEQLFRNGANHEDDGARALNHFFNPLNGSALTTAPGAYPSPAWALEDGGPINGVLGVGAQEFSFNDARKYFHQALTLPDQADRDRNFGRTFETLGHVIHHVQDMAQPQHVRNDEHCDQWYCWPIGRYHPSGYEAWTNLVRQTLPFTGYAAVYPGNNPNEFNLPRNFWATANNTGIAQFTNLNFVSARTNFDTNLFAQPAFDSALRQDVPIQTLCAGANPPCQNPNLRGTMTFFGNWVEDRVTGQRMLNQRASVQSVFDAELTRAGSRAVFTLNRFNYNAVHQFLIPRAVAYSAGLINYFFRGKIDWVADPNNPGQYLLQNIGPEQLSGDFALYYDAVDGKRYPATGGAWPQASIQSGGQQTVSLGRPGANDPEPKNPGEYMLVFRGTMGQEQPANGSVGAVAGKLVYDSFMVGLKRYVLGIARGIGPDLYGLDMEIARNPALEEAINRFGNGMHWSYNGESIACNRWALGALVCMKSDGPPYSGFIIDTTGGTGWNGKPYISTQQLTAPSGTLTLSLGNTVLFSFDFAPVGAVDLGVLSFGNAFHFNARNALIGLW